LPLLAVGKIASKHGVVGSVADVATIPWQVWVLGAMVKRHLFHSTNVHIQRASSSRIYLDIGMYQTIFM